jgi:hypothetical protein
MNNRATVAGIVIIAVYAGIVYTLVRPGSQGPALVNSVTSGITGLLQASMGKGQTWK